MNVLESDKRLDHMSSTTYVLEPSITPSGPYLTICQLDLIDPLWPIASAGSLES